VINAKLKIHPIMTQMLNGELKYIDLELEMPEGASLKTMFEMLHEHFGSVFTVKAYNIELGELHDELSVSIDGMLAEYGKSEQTFLKDGSDILIFPKYIGG